MPKVQFNKPKKIPPKIIEDVYCRVCQKKMNSNFFYEATNPLIDTNGYMSVCKSCCSDIYDKHFQETLDMHNALILTCEDLDVRFSEEAFDQCKSHVEGLLSKGKKADKIFGFYKSKLSSTGKKNEGIELLRFRDSDNKNNEISVLDDPEEIDEELINLWGNNFKSNEYKYLSDKFDEYLNTYECETPAMEELLKQAAFESLEIKVKREKREDVSKNLKNLQDLLGSANIKPNQESGANAAEQATFGTLIKKWETEEPIPEPDEEWKDVDGIGKYIRIWFLGHLCKIMNIQNEYSREYEDEMAKLRVSLPSVSEHDDSEIDEGE